MTERQFFKQADEFLTALWQDVAQNIDIPKNWDIDHLCYRVSTNEVYDSLKNEFSVFAKLLAETEVNGRLISTFKLNNAIQFQHYKIDLVELPAPKAGKHTPEGFEHIEIICDLPWSEMKTKFQAHKLNEAGLKKDFNAELELELGVRNIKFHHLSLESVVNLENNKPVFEAIKQSQILSQFKKYGALIAGTFPLNISMPNSDVDVLLTADDLEQVAQELRDLYGDHSLKIHDITVIDGLATLIAEFKFNGVPFEVFVQDRDPVKQKAYRHFQVEERLLKQGGEDLRQKILTLREQGFKTEPAFAEALGLSGDPYEALLKVVT